MTTTEQLRAAKAKIATPETWCRGAPARDDLGLSVDANSPEAVMWCVHGSIYCIGGQCPDALQTSLRQAAKRLGYANAARLNDEGTHGLVMDMLDIAIELSEKETQC